MAIGRSLGSCEIGAGDDGGIEDDGGKRHCKRTRTLSINLKWSIHDICRWRLKSRRW